MCLYPKKNFPVVLKNGTRQCFDLPCGNCLECLQQQSREWSFRCALEASLYKDNCELTLTYAQTDGSLHKSDYQKFLKRLRKAISPVKVKYFLSGEYGSKRKRPHFHILLFGWKPSDLKFLKMSRSGVPIYYSKFLNQIWTAGFITVQEFDPKGAKYCAKYLQKLQKPPEGKVKPFVAMSQGIGRDAFDEKFFDEDRIYISGQYIKLPRYFIKKIEALGEDTMLFDELQILRDRRVENMKQKQSEKNFNKLLTLFE